MPPAWVDFSWELVREERDDAKQISVIIIVIQAIVFNKRSRYLVKATLIHHHVLFVEAWVDCFACRSVVTSMLELNVDPVVEKFLTV
jgi:hypothetical protein